MLPALLPATGRRQGTEGAHLSRCGRAWQRKSVGERNLLVAFARFFELSAQIRDVPAHVSAGRHEIRCDPAFGGPARDAPGADSKRFRRMRSVDEVGHPVILSAGSARSAALGELGEFVLIDSSEAASAGRGAALP